MRLQIVGHRILLETKAGAFDFATFNKPLYEFIDEDINP
jgi:hypothetical protein